MTDILLVAGDASMRRLVRVALERRGLSVQEGGSLSGARRALRAQSFAFVIIDLALPDGSGLGVLEELHLGHPSSHVIVLSGSTTEADRLRGFEAGADDYVTKPFFARELVARILAVRRRRKGEDGTDLEIGSLHLSVVARTATIDGTPLLLTAKEFDLLAFLAARPSLVFTREELLQLVWGSSSEWQRPSTVTEHIRRLRAKIELDPKHPRLLSTVRGSGYRLDPPIARAEPHEDTRAGVVIHVDGRIVSADDAIADLLGCGPPGELVGRSILDIVAPVSRAVADELMEPMEATGAGTARRSQLLSVLHADGRAVPVEVMSSTVEWLGGRAGRLELRPEAAPSVLLSQLVTGVAAEVADAVIVTDLRLHVRSWNGGAERMYGWSEPEVIGRHILDVLRWDLDEDQVATSWRSLEASDRWHGEAHHTARDGSAVEVWASATRVKDDAGHPIAVVSVHRPSQSAAVAARHTPGPGDVVELQRGLDRGELEVHYQPVVDLTDHQVISIEALVRWRHPDRGLLGPAEFISTAEESGLIVPLGAFVLRTACEQVARWRSAGSGICLEVNLSAQELAAPGLDQAVMSALETSGLDATALWLEITETALVEDLDAVGATLQRLAAMGVGLSIDDFGTGWASLTYLRQFPVRMLKIDQVFVAGVDRNPHDIAIVRSILALGAELGLAVVAEGIETTDQEAALLALGCVMGQGFLYGRPAPATDVGPLAVHPTRALPIASPADDRRHPPPDAITGTEASASTAPAGGPPTSSGFGPEVDDQAAVVSGMLRDLLRVRSAPGAAALLQRAAEDLGGTLVAAADASDDAIPVDVSLGEGPPMLVEAEVPGVSRMHLERLLPRLAEDAREALVLLRHQERRQEACTTDALTGVGNRRALDGALTRAEAGTVAVLDLDDFKAVNDATGHQAGDEVLARFGSLLRRLGRTGDTVCRFGGEEFVLVTTDSDAATTVSFVGRIRAAWSDDTSDPVTFSAGVAPIATRGGQDALLVADRAMYRAKAMGRDRTETSAGRV